MGKRFAGMLLGGCLLFGLWGCGDRLEASSPVSFNAGSQPVATNQLAEVGTPSLIQELRKELDQYQPQLQILSPRPDELINSSTVSVKLKVDDLPLFKDPDLGMGPHVHLFIDDQPYRAVYDDTQPIVFEKLTPGSHTLRAFASRPWHESFKNEGAYAETVFHVYTKTTANTPDFDQPLLTYSRPQGTYGAEPIMLDFYLTNAPLHFVAQESQEDGVADWRIRATINGETFILDNWQPLYLKGFKKGENWVKLEFIDEQGELVNNVYNSPVRVIDYDPKLKDTLAKLVQNKIALRTAKKLVTTKPLSPEPEPEIIEPVQSEPEVLEESEDEIKAIAPEIEPTDKLENLEEIAPAETEQPNEELIIPNAVETVEEQPSEEPEAPDTIETQIENSFDAITEGFQNNLKDEAETGKPATTSEPVIEEIVIPETLSGAEVERSTDSYGEIELKP